jgi:two-component system cell cycle response regulator
MTSTLLLIDDDPEILEFLYLTLKSDYTILQVDQADKGLAILTTELAHLIVCDVLMPQMDGFEFCRQIKSNVELSHIPVILLTAKNTIQSKIDGLELGADAYIEKPFSPRHLKAQIASLISNRQLIREHFSNSPLAQIGSIAGSKADERFLASVEALVLDKMEHAELGIEMLARHLNMSRATLYRKIKAVSNLTAVEFINIIRLKKATSLLAEGKYKVYEVALITGFSSQSNFTREFHRQFKKTPTEFLRSISNPASS